MTPDSFGFASYFKKLTPIGRFAYWLLWNLLFLVGLSLWAMVKSIILPGRPFVQELLSNSGSLVVFNLFFVWLAIAHRNTKSELVTLTTASNEQQTVWVIDHDWPTAKREGALISIPRKYLDQLGIETAIYNANWADKVRQRESKAAIPIYFSLFALFIFILYLSKINIFLAVSVAFAGFATGYMICKWFDKKTAIEIDRIMVTSREQRELALKLLNYQIDWQSERARKGKLETDSRKELKLRIAQIESMSFPTPDPKRKDQSQ